MNGGPDGIPISPYFAESLNDYSSQVDVVYTYFLQDFDLIDYYYKKCQTMASHPISFPFLFVFGLYLAYRKLLVQYQVIETE